MKKLYLLILCLLITSPALAFTSAIHAVISSGATSVAECTNYEFMCENFEASTNCTSGENPYCNSSSGLPFTAAGTISFNNTSSPIRGTRNVRLSGGDAPYLTMSLSSAQNELWLHFRVKFSSLVFAKVFDTKNGGTYNINNLVLSSNGIKAKNCSDTETSEISLSAGTIYHVWVHYKTGTGNAISALYAGTSGSRASATTYAITNGTCTTSIAEVRWMVDPGDTTNYDIDQIYISATEIGDVND